MSDSRRPRRQLSDAQTTVAAILGPLDGDRLPGGCDRCDAYQTVAPSTAGVWVLTVHHDTWCPRLPDCDQYAEA